jgi:putative intracellular protease/amidase
MEIAILLFDGLTALDAVGPYEALSRLPGAEVKFVAPTPGPQLTENKSLSLVAEHALSDVERPDILLVPGGFGTRALLHDDDVREWIASAHERTRWTTSVCTGALLLGAAGVLRGLKATTHWAVLERLAEFGAEPVRERVVEQGKVITAAGVSAGIDMGLRLVQLIGGDELAQGIQLGMEYDPKPPFDTGSPATAPAHLVDVIRAAVRRAEEEFEASRRQATPG